jgi:hypothetical protein
MHSEMSEADVEAFKEAYPAEWLQLEKITKYDI